MIAPNSAPAPSPESTQPLPQLANERQPGNLKEQERVFALFYRTWMDEPELIPGVITDIVTADRPDVNGSIGYVNIATPLTSDNRTGSFIGIDINSVALIPESVLPRMKDENFLATWLVNGSEAWKGEREMLETVLRERITDGTIGLETTPKTSREHDDGHGTHHPKRARYHTKSIPGIERGKVTAARSYDLSSDGTR